MNVVTIDAQNFIFDRSFISTKFCLTFNPLLRHFT